MDQKPNTDEPGKPRRRWFQFRLRTMLIGVAALSVLFAQRPLVEWEPERFEPVTDGMAFTEQLVSEGYHFVPMRVIVVASIEGAALIGCIAWRRFAARQQNPMTLPIKDDGANRLSKDFTSSS